MRKLKETGSYWAKLMFFLSKYKLHPNKIISHKNKIKASWDIMILVLAVFNSLMVPLELSFEPAV